MSCKIISRIPNVWYKDQEWTEFSNPVEIVTTADTSQVTEKLSYVENRVNAQSLFAVGFVAYEAAAAFDSAMSTTHTPTTPLLWFALFGEENTRAISLDNKNSDPDLPELNWQSEDSKADYLSTVTRIKNDYLNTGESYQVNFTRRFVAEYQHAPKLLFDNMLSKQPTPYATFIDTEDFAVCSVSPELFFQLDGNKIVTRPMKGTRRRGKDSDDDKALHSDLQNSEKDKAENLMIVDMLRNDLGRIAKSGSVEVEKLLEIEKHPTVFQMTSTVTAQTNKSLTDIFKAIFPCASITGAPKINTMRIIDKLEKTARGVYCGALGVIAPGNRSCFSVPIRTAIIDKFESKSHYATGGGIVWDSNPECEYKETLHKGAILGIKEDEFSLLETIRWSAAGGYFLLKEHLDRITKSAENFNYALDINELTSKLEDLSQTFGHEKQRVRVLVSSSGEITIESYPLQNLPKKSITLRIAKERIEADNPLLLNKTTSREIYERAAASEPDADDVILCNTKNEVCETTIYNLVFKINGEYFTPPVESGLLPGTFRARLLKRGIIKERIILLKDLKDVKRILAINSVRGFQEAVLKR